MTTLRHITKITSLSRGEVAGVLDLACAMKEDPSRFATALARKSLLMLFEKPSLRTRVSLEVGMTQLGGHAIAYMSGDSPLGVKETYEDTGAVLSRLCDAVTARVNTRDQIAGLASAATVPVINALDDSAHPMQMLADLLTIREKKGSLAGVKLAYVGDCANNVTYDLMRAGALMGLDVRVAGPAAPGFEIEAGVLDEVRALCDAPGGGAVTVAPTAEEAVDGADVVYADSWMSYGTAGAEREARLAALAPYRVDEALMAAADPRAVFMNCLPAMRGEEQTAAVIDGPQSVVFDQAENRLHAQKALLVKLLADGLGPAP